MTEIYERLIKTLNDRNQTVKEFSKLCDIPDSSLYSLKHSVPNVNMALRIADTLRVPLEYLVCGRTSSMSNQNTDDEIKLIQKFDLLSKKRKKMLLDVADIFLNE